MEIIENNSILFLRILPNIEKWDNFPKNSVKRLKRWKMR